LYKYGADERQSTKQKLVNRPSKMPKRTPGGKKKKKGKAKGPVEPVEKVPVSHGAPVKPYSPVYANSAEVQKQTQECLNRLLKADHVRGMNDSQLTGEIVETIRRELFQHCERHDDGGILKRVCTTAYLLRRDDPTLPQPPIAFINQWNNDTDTYAICHKTTPQFHITVLIFMFYDVRPSFKKTVVVIEEPTKKGKKGKKGAKKPAGRRKP